MKILPPSIGLGELALRAANRRGAWFVLIAADPGSASEAAAELIPELELFGDDAPSHLHCPDSAQEMARSFADSPAGVLVVSGIDGFSPDDWREVDLLRSRYQRDPGVVLIMTMASMRLLMQQAPNLASWIGGTAWCWDRDADRLGQAEREAHLQALREWAGFSDDELVRRAQSGELPGDPEYAEWLVLIGRGELLGRA
jgi:hypothetical protein